MFEIFYFQKLFHVELDIGEAKLGVELSEIIVLKMFCDDAGCFEMRAFDDFYYFDDDY